MRIKKAIGVSVLSVMGLSAPLIVMAAGNPSGQPFEALQAQINELQNQINNLQGTVAYQQDLSGVQGAISNLTTQVNALQGSATSLQADLSTVQDAVGNLAAQVSALQGDTAYLQTGLSAAQGAISNLEANQSALQEAITALQTKVAQQPIQQVHVANLPTLRMTLDQNALPDDRTCQSGTLCTSWQAIPASTIGPFTVDKPSTLVLSFDGDYNCDGCVDAPGFPFVQVQIQLSTDGGGFLPVTNARGNYVPNSGVDVMRRRAIHVNAGTYTIQARHRVTTDSTNSVLLTAMTLNDGAMRVEVLGENGSGAQ